MKTMIAGVVAALSLAGAAQAATVVEPFRVYAKGWVSFGATPPYGLSIPAHLIGSVTFDDATVPPLSEYKLMSAAILTDFSFQSGTRTWTLADIEIVGSYLLFKSGRLRALELNFTTPGNFLDYGNAKLVDGDAVMFCENCLKTGSILDNSPSPIPEPSTWAMMIAGFGMAGVALRRRSLQAA